MKNKWVVAAALMVLVGGLVFGMTQSGDRVLTAVKVTQAPTLNGVGDDEAWKAATPVAIQLMGGVNFDGKGGTTVELKAVYTETTIYFLAQWADPTESNRRSPWQKQADGSWKQLKDPNDKGGDNNVYYEDKLAFIWNINDSIKGFNESGCFVTCHAGENPDKKPYGNKYTANPGEIGDIWHWKGVRTSPVGQIDDQYLDSTRYDSAKAPGAGRKSDPRFFGGYADNKTADGKLPQWALPENKPAPVYWINDAAKVAFDDSKYKAADEVPGIIIAPFYGDRGDLSAKAIWKDGKWTLEWGRRLNTGSPFDVQYLDLNKGYFFGVAAFDNAQVRHAYNLGAYELKFAK
jgi:hypothetical protein